MEVVDRVEIGRTALHNAAPVHEIFGRNQNSVNVKRMQRRDVQVGVRNQMAECRAGNLYRQHLRINTTVAPASDPLDGFCGPVERIDEIPDCQILDLDFTPGGQDMRATQNTMATAATAAGGRSHGGRAKACALRVDTIAANTAAAVISSLDDSEDRDFRQFSL